MVHGPTKTFTAGAALAQYRRVRLSSGVLAYAGASDADCLGVLLQATFAANDPATVHLVTAEGSSWGVASGAISADAVVYAAANGKIAGSGTVPVGVAMEAATADGDIIEVVYTRDGSITGLARTGLTQDDLVEYAIDPLSFRVWDALATLPVSTAANDDAALITGTFLTDPVKIQGADAKATTKTNKIGFIFAVPIEYQAAETATLRINGGMTTTVSDGTATVDAQVVRMAAPTVDICATNATTINSLTFANKDFTLTATSLVPGDLLYCVLTLAVTDTATGTAVIATIKKVSLLLDVKG